MVYPLLGKRLGIKCQQGLVFQLIRPLVSVNGIYRPLNVPALVLCKGIPVNGIQGKLRLF